jgi:four helix bundle protein
MDLVELTYRMTQQFPKEELFSLTSQIRRASISIPSNIAEGQGRGGTVEFCRFLKIAYGSLRELETQFLIAHRLCYLGDDQLEVALESAGEVGRLLNGLIKSNQ